MGVQAGLLKRRPASRNANAGPFLDDFNRLDVIRFLAKLRVRFRKEPRCQVYEGRGNSLFPGNVGCDRNVLVEQGKLERARVRASNHSLGKEILGRVGSSARSVDHFQGDPGIDAELCKGSKDFTGGPDVDCEQRLIHRLDRMTGSYPSAADDFPGECIQHRPRTIYRLAVAATHHRKRSRDRALNASADWCVNEIHTGTLQSRCDRPGCAGITRGAVYEKRSGLQTREQPRVAVEEGFHFP